MKGSVPEGRKSKKRQIDLLQGWGLRTSPQEGNSNQEEGTTALTRKWDWNDNLGSLIVERKEESQTKITAWSEVEETVLVEAGSVPDGRKEEEEEKVQAEAGGSQDEDKNLPEGRRME